MSKGEDGARPTAPTLAMSQPRQENISDSERSKSRVVSTAPSLPLLLSVCFVFVARMNPLIRLGCPCHSVYVRDPFGSAYLSDCFCPLYPSVSACVRIRLRPHLSLYESEFLSLSDVWSFVLSAFVPGVTVFRTTSNKSIILCMMPRLFIYLFISPIWNNC